MTRLARWVPLTGVIFVVLAVAGGLTTGNLPNGDASITKVTVFYRVHHDRIFASGILWTYAAIFLAFFGATLWSRVRGLGRPVLTGGTLVGTAVAVAGLLVWAAMYFALGDLGNKTAVGPTVIQSLHASTDGLFLPVLAGFEIFAWAVGLTAVLGGLLPKWLAWITLLIAILLVTPIGFFAMLAFLIWILIVSILLLVRPAAPAAPTTATV
jgi:hypothetical protein